MRTLLTVAAVLLASSPALAQEPTTQRISRDGQTYTYTVRQAGDRQVIDGRGANGRFHLVVRGDSVTGTAAGVPVSFKTSAAKDAAHRIELAAR